MVVTAERPHSKPALFVDRDGVINVDHGYVYRFQEFDFVPGIFELLRFAVNDLKWHVVVVTNQSGIGRGYFDESTFEALTEQMCQRFALEQAPITAVYHCPYHPSQGLGDYRRDHPWRKPHPGMILQAAKDLRVDLLRSVMIGDKVSDIQAAIGAGIGRCIRFDVRGQAQYVPSPPHMVVSSLAEALRILRESSVCP